MTLPYAQPHLLALPLAYLLGSVPTGYLLVRLLRHEDIRTTGSGNIGATNVARAGGKALGIATLLLDTLKGAAAVLLAFQIARHTTLNPPLPMTRAAAFSLASAAATFAVLGHVFPVWLRFRGGKGVATALGVFLVLSPPATGIALLAFLLVFALTRTVSLASILAALTLLISSIFLLRNHTLWTLTAFLGIPILIIAKHHANLRRLFAGTEPRFGQPKPAPPTDAPTSIQ